MAIATTRDYPGERIGTHGGLPVYGIRDPCAAGGITDRPGVVIGVHGGLPVVAVSDCQLPVSTSKDYVGHRIGMHGGLPVYAVGCESCGIGSCKVRFAVRGCNSLPLPNASITFDGNTYTTDASGVAEAPYSGAGTYAYSISKTKFTTTSGSIAVATCTTPTTYSVSVILTVATGYHCVCGCPDPLPETIYLTNDHGTCTLEWYEGTDVPDEWTGAPASCYGAGLGLWLPGWYGKQTFTTEVGSNGQCANPGTAGGENCGDPLGYNDCLFGEYTPADPGIYAATIATGSGSLYFSFLAPVSAIAYPPYGNDCHPVGTAGTLEIWAEFAFKPRNIGDPSHKIVLYSGNRSDTCSTSIPGWGCSSRFFPLAIPATSVSDCTGPTFTFEPTLPNDIEPTGTTVITE